MELESMGYRYIKHKDSEKEENIWICTSHFHELLVPNPDALQYIDISHLSGKFSEPLTVLFAGHGRWFNVRRMERNGQPGIFGIEYVRSGNLILFKDKKQLLVEKGDIYFLNRDFPDSDCTGPAGSLSKYYLWLTGTVLENLLHSLNLSGRNSLHLDAAEEFESLMKRMVTLLAKNQPDVDSKASALALEILLFLGKSIRQQIPLILKDTMAYIQQNLHNRLDIKEICSQLNVNDIYLRRLFLKYIKVSPMKYILEQKLIWSANLLTTTSLSIKEVAYEIGYLDPFYFSNQFKKYFGKSPKQYREMNQLV
jgi:AraC-like DNA-binding protein